jgi:Phosphotransferase enzyme family
MTIPQTADDLTTEWFRSVLGDDVGEVTSVAPIGTGQMAYCYRVDMGDHRFAVKMAGPDATVLQSGAYVAEVSFYREIAPRLGAGLAKCHYAAISDDALKFVLVLDDLAPAQQGDQLAGCSRSAAEAAVRTIAAIQAPLWNDPSLREFNVPPLTPEEQMELFQTYMRMATDVFLPKFEAWMMPEDLAVLAAFADRAGEWGASHQEPFGIVHGDFRLDNLLFDESNCFAVDWQTASACNPLRDMGFFCATSLLIEDRRAWERELIAMYHGLIDQPDYSLEQCWDDYRYGIAQGAWVTIIGHWAARQSDRGDEMFVAMATRTAAAMRDLNTLETF